MKHIHHALMFLTVLPIACSSASRVDTRREPLIAERAAVAQRGMVVSANPYASKAGARILREGGSAVDAAIAVQLALNVVEPQNSGLGGGGFLMYYEKSTGRITIIDSRERAPATAHPSMFLGTDGVTPIPFATRQTLGLSVGVPGTPMGIAAAHQRWGRLPFKHLVQPAIALAEEGFPVNFALATDIATQRSKLVLDPTAGSVFVPGGVALVENDLLVQPALANTLKAIRDGDTSRFYEGPIATALLSAVTARGGTMTAADLSGYTLSIDAPIMDAWHGFTMAAMPPPSSGGTTVLQILKLTEAKTIASYGVQSTTRYHVLTEATRLAFADRAAFIGDPEFVSVPVAGLLDPGYIASRAALINTASKLSSVVAGNPAGYVGTAWPASTDTFGLADIEGGETTHFSVADDEGNIVAWTSTIEQAFGSGIMVPGYGYMLNNEVTDFNATPTGPNQAGPHKRPMSSMSPMILLKDGTPFLTVGASGGPRIIAAVAQVLQNEYDHGLSLTAAIDEPRIFGTATGTAASTIMWQDTSLWIPGGAMVPSSARTGLAALGHVPASTPVARGFLGVVQAIGIETGVYTGVADRQRQGSAIGISP
jgi:gamma-glutamyltranspeptidase / glutathione hydrolase